MTELKKGSQVRLVNDPGRIGIIMGEPRTRAATNYFRVQFPEGPATHAEYELELLSQDDNDPYALLERGTFGRGRDLRRHLTHIQLSGRLANLVYSMDTTNVDFYAYQYKPVLSFLESPAKGLLIADEVGLGKTIEAGLIWTELRLRLDARRLLVVCPAMLREKWKAELQRRFGVHATIMDAKELLHELRRNKADIPDATAIICSTQGLRPPRERADDGYDNTTTSPRAQLASLLEDQASGEPLIDMLIVDEAHHMRNPDSQTSRLGRLLRDVSDHLVLLSATPINLRSDDLYYLLNLADPDTFYFKGLFPQVLAANEPLLRAQVAARDMNATGTDIKGHLIKAMESSLLRGNRQLAGLLQENMGPELLASRTERVQLANRIERINLLRHVLTRTRKADVTEWRVVRRAKTLNVQLTEAEADFYSRVTEAIRDFAFQSDLSDGFLLATPQRQMSSCMPAAVLAWKNRNGGSTEEQVYEDFGVEPESIASVSPLIQHLVTNVLPFVNLKTLHDQDSKYSDFRTALSGYLKKHPGEKVVVFSFFRETLRYLSRRLSEDGITNDVLMGGIKGSKQEVIDRFEDSPDLQVLLASEVACEGVDIQFCRVLFNYDLPWNPTKVDQRIGRIDRLGQLADVISIINFCYEGTIDQRIHDRLLLRLNIFEKALGGMEAILGEQITELASELLMNKLTVEEETRRIEQTALAVETIRLEQEQLEGQAANLIAHSGFILEKVFAAREFNRRINERDLFIYVRDYLESFWQGHELRQVVEEELRFEIRLPAGLVAQLRDFIKIRRLYNQTRLAEGGMVRCQFANKVGTTRAAFENISQFHPLVRFISEDLKSRGNAYCPLVAIEVANEPGSTFAAGTYAFALERWNFSGLREEEELQARVVALQGDATVDSDQSWGLVSLARTSGKDWLGAANETDSFVVAEALDDCALALQADFQKTLKQRQNENFDRVGFQLRSAEKHLERQMAIQQQILHTHQQRKNEKMIPLTRARMRKIQERFDVQIAGLKTREDLKGARFDVSCGLIRITN